VTDKRYVLDASALLAVFFAEPGADHIAERMEGAMMSAVNLSEVVAKLVDRGTPTDRILDVIAQLDIDVVAVDREQAVQAGLLRDQTRTAGLSLGDRACLAVAAATGRIALTTDRAWAKVDMDVAIEIAR
jgi:ribonuclease VapC